MNVQIFMLKQDDPTKCTAAKLVKFGLAKQVRQTLRETIVLDPFSEQTLMKGDSYGVGSITAIDCSWELAQKIFGRRFKGISRKLPPLLAGNPVNYSKVGKLTTAESLAASLYIMGFNEMSYEILNKFKWGHTFFELNGELLKEYAEANTSEEVLSISRSYGLIN